MDILEAIAPLIFGLVVCAMILFLGINDYRQRRDHNARMKKSSDEVFEWLKRQPDEIKRKFLADYDALKNKRGAGR